MSLISLGNATHLRDGLQEYAARLALIRYRPRPNEADAVVCRVDPDETVRKPHIRIPIRTDLLSEFDVPPCDGS